MERDMTKPVPDFRIRMRESERGWGQSTDYQHFDTYAAAKKYFDEDLAERKKATSTPDYYYICEGPIEKFDPITKNWKEIT